MSTVQDAMDKIGSLEKFSNMRSFQVFSVFHITLPVRFWTDFGRKQNKDFSFHTEKSFKRISNEMSIHEKALLIPPFFFLVLFSFNPCLSVRFSCAKVMRNTEKLGMA